MSLNRYVAKESATLIDLNEILGRVRVFEIKRTLPDGVQFGSWSIVYGRDGNELRRTEPDWHGVLRCEGMSGEEFMRNYGNNFPDKEWG